jgi:hypothetical protein
VLAVASSVRILAVDGIVAEYTNNPIQIPTTRPSIAVKVPIGTNPSNSVTDPSGRFHHIANAFCADQSLFVTVGSVNPTLTGLVLSRKVAQAAVALASGAPPPPSLSLPSPPSPRQSRIERAGFPLRYGVASMRRKLPYVAAPSMRVGW